MACHQLTFSKCMNPAAWKLASKSLETCGCMKRNVKHTAELRIIWDCQCYCYFVAVAQCLQWQKVVLSSVSLETTAHSVRANHTRAKQTQRGAGWHQGQCHVLQFLEEVVSWMLCLGSCQAERGLSRSRWLCLTAWHSRSRQTYASKGKVLISQERTGILPRSKWQSLAIFCNRLTITIWNFLSCYCWWWFHICVYKERCGGPYIKDALVRAIWSQEM